MKSTTQQPLLSKPKIESTESTKLFTDDYKNELENASYAIVGNHSAVEICGWTKKSMKGNEGGCYKQKFYGIRSHQCTQMSPAAVACDQKCTFCWKANEFFSGKQDLMEEANDDPNDIIEDSITAHLKKLSGFGGNERIDKQTFEESKHVRHFAISLTGEPTLYKRLPEMIKELHRREISSFLVTNGLHPEVLEKLDKENALPTQLYMSLDAPDKKTWKKIDIPLIPDFWERVLGSLKTMSKLKTRKVLRMTLVREWNDFDAKGYADLIRRSGEDTMIEVKSYMHLGPARKRLSKKNMLDHEEVRIFAKKIAEELGWKIIDEAENSRVVLIAKNDWEGRKIDFGKPIPDKVSNPFSC